MKGLGFSGAFFIAAPLFRHKSNPEGNWSMDQQPKHANEVDQDLLAPWLGGRSFDDCCAEYDKQGYVTFENVMPPKDVDNVRAALEPYLIKTGRNDFEGFKSNRVYALLAKSPDVFSKMVMHPLVMAFVERELGVSSLLSALLAINLHPGETVQDWHYDDSQVNIPLPHPPYGVSAFWAIDDMSETNGATEIIAKSHLWTKPEISMPDFEDAYDPRERDVNFDPKPHADALKVTLPSGSLMVAKGTLWHRGGANRSNSSRLIVTPQYCPGWARQLENMMATMPAADAAKLPKRVRELMGYSIHDAFMGYVDGVHPDRLLDKLS